jgi:6-phosphogluconolactonase
MTTARTEHERPVSAYAAVGGVLIHFSVNVAAAGLTRRSSIRLPGRIQYAWPHVSLPILYVACADKTPGISGDRFFVCALLMDSHGDLSTHGKPVVLESRPVHITTDIPSRHVLTAYSDHPGLTVHEILNDGTIGIQIPRPEPFDFGVRPHQVRVTPSNTRVIITARGGRGYGSPSYTAGGLKVLRYSDGTVENMYTVNLEGKHGLAGFNPRHLDFHPTLPLVFVSLEGQNKISVLRLEDDGINPEPLFTKDILAQPDMVRPRQDAGTVHVHPNGKYVYIANRNDGRIGGHPRGISWLNPDPIPVFPGGENNIAVFEIDEKTGEPTLVQNIDSQGLHPRTFALDPSGRTLVAGNLSPTVLRDGASSRQVPAGLALFTVHENGKLEFIRKYDLDVGTEMIWWMGVVGH